MLRRLSLLKQTIAMIKKNKPKTSAKHRYLVNHSNGIVRVFIKTAVVLEKRV